VADVAPTELANFPAGEPQRCRAAGAVGRASSPAGSGGFQPRVGVRSPRHCRIMRQDAPEPAGSKPALLSMASPPAGASGFQPRLVPPPSLRVWHRSFLIALTARRAVRSCGGPPSGKKPSAFCLSIPLPPFRKTFSSFRILHSAFGGFPNLQSAVAARNACNTLWSCGLS